MFYYDQPRKSEEGGELTQEPLRDLKWGRRLSKGEKKEKTGPTDPEKEGPKYQSKKSESQKSASNFK